MKNIMLSGIVLFIFFISGYTHAVSITLEKDVRRSDKAGETIAVLEPHNTHFCVLVYTRFEETDTSQEEAECDLYHDNSVWVLKARLRKSSDTRVSCTTMCYDF